MAGPQYDQWGNVTYDDGHTWFNSGGYRVDSQTGQPVAGSSPLDATIAQVSADSGSSKSPQHITLPNGELGYFDPNDGTYHNQDGSIYTGPGKSSGGGSTNPTMVFIQQNPGGLMVQKTVPPEGDGSGFPPGTVYQENQVTGAQNILYRPTATASNPRDKNNDGIDDSTGWASGVYKDSSSPSGYYYPRDDGTLVPVLPNGAEYHGPDLTGGSSTNLHYFSSGGIEYVYDPATGKSRPIGGTGPTGGGGGGSSGGGGNSAAQAAQISAAASTANAAMQAQTAANDLAEKMREFGITSDFQKQQFAENTRQFGMTYALQQAAQQQQKEKDDKAAAQQRADTTVKYVSNPNDLVARDYWLHSGMEPTGTPVDIFTGKTAGPLTTQGAVNDQQSMQAAQGIASSAPPPQAGSVATMPPLPGYRGGTDVRAGYTTAPVAKVGERGTEMMINPTGAPIRILNHQQVVGRQSVPPPGFATGTDGTYTDGGVTYTYTTGPNAAWDQPYYSAAPTTNSAVGNDPNGPAFNNDGSIANVYAADTTPYYGPGAQTAGQTGAADYGAMFYNYNGGLNPNTGKAAGGYAAAVNPPTPPDPAQSGAAADKAAADYTKQETTPGGYHIDPATGRLVPNAGTLAPGIDPATGQPIQKAAAPTASTTAAPPPGTTTAAAPPQVYKPYVAPPPPPQLVTRNSAAPVTNPAINALGQPITVPQTQMVVAPPPPAQQMQAPVDTVTGATPTKDGVGIAAPPQTPMPSGPGATPAPPPAGPAAIAYDPSVYANLPSLRYLQGLMSPQDFANLTSNTSSAGGLGGALPAPNQLNYAYLQNLKQTDPTGWAAMQSIWKARNRDIDQEMAYAQQRAPVGNAVSTDTIST